MYDDQTISTTFVYCPTTGDRVFAEQPTAEILVIRWHNGSRHVVGGRHLTVPAAQPGSWWRPQACVMAARIVRAVGGIAYDAQGAIGLIVPTHAAPRAAHLMVAAAPDSYELVTELHAQAGTPLSSDLTFAAVPSARPPETPTAAWSVTRIERIEITGTDHDGPRILVTAKRPGQADQPTRVISVTAPATWTGAWRSGYAAGEVCAPAEAEPEIVRAPDDEVQMAQAPVGAPLVERW